MNIIARLTLRHLLQNRKRSVMTILGIAFSAALISSIILGVLSFFRFFGTVAERSEGHVHALFKEVSMEQVQHLKEDPAIACAGVMDSDPKVSGIRVNSGKAERYCVGNIMHGDADLFSMTVNSDYEGRLPENASEIAVEEAYLQDNGLSYSLGDSLSFETGSRYSYDENGTIVYWAGNYRSEEQFEKVSDDTCTITAILHGNHPTAGYDILRGLDGNHSFETKYTEVRIALKNCDHTAIRQIQNIAAKYNLAKVAINTEYMVSVFAFEGSSGAYQSLFVMMGIALLVVIVASVIMIVNSLEMSLSERIRYLGMLASVGATGRQKCFSVVFESLVLGAFGIPLGILAGILGTRATLALLGRRILEADFIAGAEGMHGSIPLIAPAWAIAAVVLLSGLAIFFSSLVPARKASKIMPIDALKQTGTIRLKPGSLKVSPLVRKIFGYEGELACKNIQRNGLKGRVITVSIAVSVILFLTISFFCDSLERVNQYDLNLPAQVAVSVSFAEHDRLKEALCETEGVERVFCGGMIQFPFEKGKDENVIPANRDILNMEYRNRDYRNLPIREMMLVLVEDDDFKKLLDANGISSEGYFEGTLRGVLLNSFFHDKRSGDVFNEGILGQSLHYDEAEGNPPAVEIGDFVQFDGSNDIFNLVPKGTITVYAPESVYYKRAAETLPADQLTYDFFVVTKEPDEVCERIYAMLEAEGYHSYSCSDLTDTIEAMHTVTTILKTAMYGFTVLLTLIAMTNIINTISTGMLLRRKEFAMYRSVGMEPGGFTKMIRLETLLYGVRALLVGIPVSVALSYLMYRVFDEKLYVFRINLPMYLSVITAVFVIVGASMVLSVNTIRDDSIIETLREDAV